MAIDSSLNVVAVGDGQGLGLVQTLELRDGRVVTCVVDHDVRRLLTQILDELRQQRARAQKERR